MQHAIVTRGSLSAVRFGVELQTAEVEAHLAEYGLCPGGTDDILSFRMSNQAEWSEFAPMVALDSEIRHGQNKFVAFATRGGDPYGIILKSKEGTEPWGPEIWFICKKIEPLDFD